jgi:hypothetical protein
MEPFAGISIAQSDQPLPSSKNHITSIGLVETRGLDVESTVEEATMSAKWNELSSHLILPALVTEDNWVHKDMATFSHLPFPNLGDIPVSGMLDLPPVPLRRRTLADITREPSTSMIPSYERLSRRVSSGTHPYLAVSDSVSESSHLHSPAARKALCASHAMTHLEVLELLATDAKGNTSEKFVCDYPGCRQRFSRNSNKRNFSSVDGG